MAFNEDATSLSKMRTSQFNEKMATLNRDFLKSLRIWYEQCPHYDFSDTVKSYLKHIVKLEQTYGVPDENRPVEPNQPLEVSSSEHPERKIAKAKRRLTGDASKLNDSVAVSTPAGDPPRFSLGDVSAIESATDTPRVSIADPLSAQGGRKRVIRGGGPTGGPESVHFRGSEKKGNTLTVPPVTIELPKPTAGFWDKHKNTNHTGTMPVIDLVKPAVEILPPGMAANVAETPTKQPSKITFGGHVNDPEAPKVSLFQEKFTPLFGKSAPDSNVFGKSDDKISFPAVNNQNSDKPALSFPSSDKPAISFPLFGKKDDGTTKPGLSFPSFVSSGPLTFGGLIKASGNVENDDEETAGEDTNDDGEYVPPKADPLEKDEPGAFLSVKCSVFKMVDKKFEKLGVGMMHLKENDGKKSVLVRAATAIGTIWINALINSTMKVAKADDKGDKLRLTVPLSATEMGIFLVRLPGPADAEKVQKHIEENNK